MKILVVGAGFSGAVTARQFADAGHLVRVIEKRDHVAGNSYDFVNTHGIRVHKYGPHIFHTSNERVADYIRRFCSWVPFEHRVQALLQDGSYVPFPVNSVTKNIVGSDKIVDTFFRPYTKKMWGIDIENLDSGVLQRVPIRQNDEDRYFPDDSFQGFPECGYTNLVENILQHRRIQTDVCTHFRHNLIDDYDHVFSSMPIDEFFLFDLGHLPYRSIRFHEYTIPLPRVLPEAVINFTNDGPFTRVTEWKHFPNHGGSHTHTTLTFEEPCSYEENDYERYYPVKDAAGYNRLLYKRYHQRVPERVTFIGRCGQYAYLDMHQAINSALQMSDRFLSRSGNPPGE